MTEQEVNNLIDSKIGKVKMSQLPEATQTSGLYSIGYTGNQSVKYKANLLQGDPLTVRKTYQTEAEAIADKNPIDTTTSLPLKIGQFVSIVDDGEKDGIYRIGSISGDGTMSLELQGKLGDLSDYAKKVDVEFKSNKQNSLAPDGTGEKYVTVDAAVEGFASRYIDITTEVKTGMVVNSRNGLLFVPSVGADKSSYCENVYVKDFDYIYYTGSAYSQSGIAFYNEDFSYHSVGLENNTPNVFNKEIAVPEGAYYATASSRNSDVIVKISADISEMLKSAYYKSFINESNITDIYNELSDNRIDIDINKGAINSMISSDSYYSRLNGVDYVHSLINLDKRYSIETPNDFIEFEARYFGGESYTESIRLLTIGYQGLGWYSDTQIWGRIKSGEYIQWNDINDIDRYSWNHYRLVTRANGFELYINGKSYGIRGDSTQISYAKIEGFSIASGFEAKYDLIKIKISSSIDGTLDIDQPYSYPLSQNIDLKKLKESDNKPSVMLNNPMAFTTWDKENQLIKAYTRDIELQHIYYLFTVKLVSSRNTIDDAIHFQHMWRVTSISAKCIYDNETNAMTETNVTLVTGAESESVYMGVDDNGVKVDFTGGFHGDETIDVTDGDFVDFYMNGVKLSEADLAESFELKPCNEVSYIQRSSMHRTAYQIRNVETNIDATGAGVLTVEVSDTEYADTFFIDGINTGFKAYSQNSVFKTPSEAISAGFSISANSNGKWEFNRLNIIYPNRDVVSTHIKHVVFKNATMISENTLIFKDTESVDHWFFGIYCLSKQVATIGHNENYEDVEFTGSETRFLESTENRILEAYNPLTKMSSKIESALLNGGGLFADEDCTMFIWDRSTDSKYYRKTPQFTPLAGTKVKGRLIAKFNTGVE